MEEGGRRDGRQMRRGKKGEGKEEGGWIWEERRRGNEGLETDEKPKEGGGEGRWGDEGRGREGLEADEERKEGEGKGDGELDGWGRDG